MTSIGQRVADSVPLSEEERPAAEARKRFVGAWSASALLVLVLASVVPAALSMSWPRAILLGLVGVAYLLVTTIGARAVEARPTAAWLTLLFGAQLLLASLAITVSRGYALLMVLGTVSEAVLYLRVRAAAAVVALVMGLLAYALSLAAPDIAMAARGLASTLAAVTFVIAFSWMALRQHDGRVAQARLTAQLEQANEQLRAHASELSALAAERERVRIAREIHDSLGHCLTGTHIQLEVATAFLETDPARARSAIATSSRMVHEGIDELRRSVAALRDEPRIPLPGRLVVLLETARASGLEATLHVEGTPRELALQVELTLFRVAQEALTNVQRHARADRVDVTLRFEDERVELCVQDDGVGDLPPTEGSGLRGMRERIVALAGSLTLEPASGFLVRAEVPA